MEKRTLGDDLVGEDILQNYYLCKMGVYQVIKSTDAGVTARIQTKPKGEYSERYFSLLGCLEDERVFIIGETESAQSRPKCTEPIRGEDPSQPDEHPFKKGGDPPRLSRKD